MRCPTCRQDAMTERKELRRGYAGLSHVAIDGALVRHCTNCGEEAVGYKNIEELHRVIALCVALKPSALAPEEIRFLRTHLGLSTEDLAKRMGVARESVSRWERADGEYPMNPPAERLLRLMAVRDQPVEKYPLERLDEVATGEPVPMELRLQSIGKGWRPEAV